MLTCKVWRLRSRAAAACLCATGSVLIATAGSAFPAVAIATAAGTGWVAQKLPSGTPVLEGVSCVNADDCWAAGSRFARDGDWYPAIVATTDGGVRWVSQKLPSAVNGSVLGISCTSARDCVAVGSEDSPVSIGDGSAGLTLVTSNGGATWQAEPLVPNNGFQSVSCTSTTRCWAVLINSVVFTTNAGASWVTQYSSRHQALNSVTCDGAHCLAAGQSKIRPEDGIMLATFNGGATWQRERLPTRTPGLGSVACPTESTCWASSLNGAVGHVIVTHDGGRTWETQLAAADSFSAIACASASDCWVVGQAGNIDATSNAGRTWSAQPAPSPRDYLFAIACTRARCWAVGQLVGGRAKSLEGAIITRAVQ